MKTFWPGLSFSKGCFRVKVFRVNIRVKTGIRHLVVVFRCQEMHYVIGGPHKYRNTNVSVCLSVFVL